MRLMVMVNDDLERSVLTTTAKHSKQLMVIASLPLIHARSPIDALLQRTNANLQDVERHRRCIAS